MPQAMQPLPRRPGAHALRSHLLVCAACAALAGCVDSPTAPESYVQQAGGSVWVAVTEPAGMPDARTWSAFVDPQSPAAARLRELRDGAGRARRAGRLEEQAALEAEAMRAAAASMTRTPDPRTVLVALAALESWVQRAEGRLATGSYPELEEAATRVRSWREQARVSLLRGDTAAAAGEITRAAQEARAFTPVAVALRLVGRAEARIDAVESPSENLKRARHLLLTAREAMATGDQTRALKRAWYALQLIEMESRRSPSGGRAQRP